MSLSTGGLILGIVGSLWIVIVAFQAGLFWGLGSLFVPIVGLIFCILNFREMWKPLLLAVIGWGLFFGHFGTPAFR